MWVGIHTVIARWVGWMDGTAALWKLFLPSLFSVKRVWRWIHFSPMYRLCNFSSPGKVGTPLQTPSGSFCLVTKSWPILHAPMDCSQTGSSVHGILQATILEWVAISFSRGSFWPRDGTHVSCIGRWVLYHWATQKMPGTSVLCGGKVPDHQEPLSFSLLDNRDPAFSHPL